MSLPTSHLLSWHWDPTREMLYLPGVGRPVMWYGFLFVLGFILGYWIFIPLLMVELRSEVAVTASSTLRQQCSRLADLLIWYLMIGAIVGARLGHVVFYDWPTYQQDWLGMLRIWEGGLASHGGTVGAMIAVLLFRWRIQSAYPALTLIRLLDLICIPTALTATLIRLGNFVNQEILGTPTDLPWAVVFGHPADGSLPLARHPVQLYEAGVYLATFIVLLVLWRRYRLYLPQGAISGLFFSIVFGSRLVLEAYKAPQSLIIDESHGMMGQYLSLPFVAFGLAMLLYAYWPRRLLKTSG